MRVDFTAALSEQEVSNGLFTLMAQEERNIRENPLQRGTALMRRVFAAQD